MTGYPHRTLALLTLILILGGGPAQAAPDFVFSPEEQKVTYPKATFDPDLHKALLAPGTASIVGVAYDQQKSKLLEKKKPKQHLPEGTKIYLFPYTPYTKEVVQLFKKHEPVEEEHTMDVLMAEAQLRLVTGEGLPELLPKTRVETDPQFAKIWKATSVVGKEGKFVFEGLQPGVYYLQSTPIMTARHYVYDVQVGEEVQEIWYKGVEVGTSSTPIWASDSQTTYRKVELAKIVEVKQDGQVVEVELNETFRDVKIR